MTEENKMSGRTKTFLFLLFFTGCYVVYSFSINSLRNGLLSSILFVVLLIIYFANLYIEANKEMNNTVKKERE